MPLTHEPPGYRCPFCLLQSGIIDDRKLPSDVIAVTEKAFARIAPKWWPANPGAALVFPRKHVENIYALSADDGHAVWDLTQRVAMASRSAYESDGVSIRQHNEPAGGQDVWHLHVHVFPRWENDALYQRDAESEWVDPSAREFNAQKLRQELELPVTFTGENTVGRVVLD